MIDPNVPSYFLIILCGFGAVWGYRKIIKTSTKISEFEYVAFSTLWGSLIFLPIAFFLVATDLLAWLSIYPFVATPILFLIGLILGVMTAWSVKIFKKYN